MFVIVLNVRRVQPLRREVSCVEYTPWLDTPLFSQFSKMNIREVFAQNLKKYRRLRKISQEELAYAADIDRTYVSALERTIYSASLDVVASIAKALDVEPSELLVKQRKK